MEPGSRHRRVGVSDVRFAVLLLAFAYLLTVLLWAGHRTLGEVEPGRSTSGVVIAGALFGTLGALTDLFTRRRVVGRTSAVAAGVLVVAVLLPGLTGLFGSPDGSPLRDVVPVLLAFGTAAAASVATLVLLTRRDG